MESPSTENIIKILKELSPVLDTATMARMPFEIKYFVAGRHVHPMQQFRQLVIELQIATGAIKSCVIGRRKRVIRKREIELEITELKANLDEKNQCKIDLKLCELDEILLAEEQEDRALAGKIKEVQVMHKLLTTEYQDWLGKTEEEQLVYEKEYWVYRLANQAATEAAGLGRIGPGMLETIRKLPDLERHEIMSKSLLEDLEWNRWMNHEKQEALITASQAANFESPTTYIGHDFLPMRLRKDAPSDYPPNLIIDTDRIDIVVGILHRNLESDQPIHTNFIFPVGKNYIALRDQCPGPEFIGEYKYRLALNAESLGATHLFILDDDIDAPPNIILKLYNHKLDIVGAWYPRKVDPPDSASMILKDGRPEPVPAGKGLIKIDWSLAAGCTLYKISTLQKLPRPWFKTTHKCTEDTYLTNLAKEHNIDSWLDRNIKVKHIDKANNRTYIIGA